MTSVPMALARMLARSSSATPTLTSPSSKASRISASAASRCSSVSLPWPRRFLKVRCSFSVRFSNIFLVFRNLAGDAFYSTPEKRTGRSACATQSIILGWARMRVKPPWQEFPRKLSREISGALEGRANPNLCGSEGEADADLRGKGNADGGAGAEEVAEGAGGNQELLGTGDWFGLRTGGVQA